METKTIALNKATVEMSPSELQALFGVLSWVSDTRAGNFPNRVQLRTLGDEFASIIRNPILTQAPISDRPTSSL